MVKFYAEICYVIFHRETAGAVGVISLEVDAGVQVSFPIIGDFVVLFEDSLEMESVALSDIFDTKVINEQEKHNRLPLVAPQASSGGALVVAVLLETFFEESVGQGPRLWDTINAVTNIKVNPAIGMDVVHEAVLVDEFFWDFTQFDANVLRSVQGCLKCL